jgi:hypothetical protein
MSSSANKRKSTSSWKKSCSTTSTPPRT